MAGEIGKVAAEELRGKLAIDEQQKIASESDETYDAQLLAHLQEKLQPEIEAFNEQAEFADALTVETSSGMLQFYRDNKPAYAVLVHKRKLLFLSPESKEPVRTLAAAGGPEEYAFQGGSGSAAAMSEEDLLKGLIRTAVGGTFEAK